MHAVLSHLTGRQVAEACARAQDGARDHRLALLIAQAAGSQAHRHMLRKQLQQWHDNKVSYSLSHF